MVGLWFSSVREMEHQRSLNNHRYHLASVLVKDICSGRPGSASCFGDFWDDWDRDVGILRSSKKFALSTRSHVSSCSPRISGHSLTGGEKDGEVARVGVFGFGYGWILNQLGAEFKL